MSAPTINEMLAWLDDAWVYGEVTGKVRVMVGAIRAILEQVRASETLSGTIAEWLVVKRGLELEAIRAFVERVEKRLPDYNTGKGADSWLKAYRLAVMDELTEMEKQ